MQSRYILGTAGLLLFTVLAVYLLFSAALRAQAPFDYRRLEGLKYDVASQSLSWTYTYGSMGQDEVYKASTTPITCTAIEGNQTVECDYPVVLSDDNYALLTSEAIALLDHAYNIQQIVETNSSQRASR